ncbi:hypothetical protein EK904_006115 [Melospiza melodia maxima]|nr:hypothetical protein EK904_006115 [Melospiza melodia maxima]
MPAVKAANVNSPSQKSFGSLCALNQLQGQPLDIEKFSAQTKNERQFCILAGVAGLSSKHLTFGRGRSEEAPGETMWSCFNGFPHLPFVNAAVHSSLKREGAESKARLAVWQEGRLGEKGHLNQELLWAKGCSGGKGPALSPPKGTERFGLHQIHFAGGLVPCDNPYCPQYFICLYLIKLIIVLFFKEVKLTFPHLFFSLPGLPGLLFDKKKQSSLARNCCIFNSKQIFFFPERLIIWCSSHPTCLKQNLSALQGDGDSSLLWGWLEREIKDVAAPFTLTLYLLLEPVSHYSKPELLLGFCVWWLKMCIAMQRPLLSDCQPQCDTALVGDKYLTVCVCGVKILVSSGGSFHIKCEPGCFREKKSCSPEILNLPCPLLGKLCCIHKHHLSLSHLDSHPGQAPPGTRLPLQTYVEFFQGFSPWIVNRWAGKEKGREKIHELSLNGLERALGWPGMVGELFATPAGTHLCSPLGLLCSLLSPLIPHYGFLTDHKPRKRVGRGSFLPVVINTWGLGFSEKTPILKETISSLGEAKAFVYCSSKQNSMNCRGYSPALSIPQSIILTCGVCELPAQLQRQMEI